MPLTPAVGVIKSRHLEQHLLLREAGTLDHRLSATPLPPRIGADLPPEEDRSATPVPVSGRGSELPTVDLDVPERLAITQALFENHGNKSETARRLGVSRAGLYRKMQRHGITN